MPGRPAEPLTPPAPTADPLQALDSIRRTALAAADAGQAVRRALRATADGLIAGGQRLPLPAAARLRLVAIGKAAPAMAAAALEGLGERAAEGLVVVPAGTPVDPHSPAARLRWIEAGHPLPDAGSLRAGEAAAALLAGAAAHDLTLALISGGGSALFELPHPGVTLDDLRALNDLLLRSGAPIQQMNIVRRALSRVKGGGLARLAAPSRTLALILSDVVGDTLAAVASGPTVPRPSQAGRARAVLHEHGLWEQVPPSVRDALQAPAARPASGRRMPRPLNLLVGGNRMVVEAAAAEAARLGYPPRVLSDRMTGEARAVGARLARRLLRTARPCCLLLGGETTVSVRGGGRGGRNQEAALAAAIVLEGRPGTAVLALATDGVDGPTDAAGAAVTGETLAAARARGFDPGRALEENDSYPLLDAAGALLRSGPTGTNVSDLLVGLAWDPAARPV